MPSLSGAVAWVNSPPLTAEGLKGKVVLGDFWTSSCINCLRAIPYVRAWAEKYKDQGLVVIGVHAPEFAFEKNTDNVKKAASDLKIGYPVAIDNVRSGGPSTINIGRRIILSMRKVVSGTIISAKATMMDPGFLVGKEGMVVGVDISSGMLDQAAKAIMAAGLSNIKLVQ
jgi:thiol-disulfide isomerase/thioredoxin